MLAGVLHAAWWAPLQNATYGLVPAADCAHTHAHTQAALVLCVLVSPVFFYPHSFSNIFSRTFPFGSFGFPLDSAKRFEMPSVVN